MKRLPIILSTAALVVAVLGSTPAGHAVGSKVPLFAKQAGYATRAGNAESLNGRAQRFRMASGRVSRFSVPRARRR